MHRASFQCGTIISNCVETTPFIARPFVPSVCVTAAGALDQYLKFSVIARSRSTPGSAILCSKVEARMFRR
jgi:hypothetical protein